MAKLKIPGQELINIVKFEIKCQKCDSKNCQVVINYSSYPESISNDTFIVCLDCKEEEQLIND